MTDVVKLKPNEEQRLLIDSLKQMIGLNNVHGEDQKTIYWALAFAKEVSHLIKLDQVMKFKGVAEFNFEQFKSKKYQNVKNNAKKSPPKIVKDGFSSTPIE